MLQSAGEAMLRPLRRATLVGTERFIGIASYSGYRSSYFDPLGAQLELDPLCSNTDLGVAIQEALDKSRFLLPEQLIDLARQSAAAYEGWLTALCSRSGYSSRRKFFRGLKSCGIQDDGDTIVFTPTVRDGEGWADQARSEAVAVPVGAAAERVGAAAREALGRSIA